MIKIDGIHKYYGDLHVLKGIDLTIVRGSVYAVIGPSGSGKSTMLRCINRLEEIQEGSIWVDNEDISHADTNLDFLRSQLGFVFQDFNLFPHMSVLKNITLGPMKVHGWDEERANNKALELLSSVNLSDKAESFPSQLSGGQKQRVAIARALAMEPEIMLFDEPTSALDPEMIKEVLDVIRDIAQGSTMTVVIVTHEMGFAKEIADNIVFMDDGQIIEQKSPKDFFSSPEHPRSVEFLNKVL